MIRALTFHFLAVYALFLRWTIWEAESHLRECAADGLIESLSIRAFRGQIDQDRVRLAEVHRRMYRNTATKGA